MLVTPHSWDQSRCELEGLLGRHSCNHKGHLGIITADVTPDSKSFQILPKGPVVSYSPK